MISAVSQARLIPAAACALLCLMLAVGDTNAQSTPAAPTIDSVTPFDTTLVVAWTAPSGETGITAYDVRHIETSEDETDATKWTVDDNAWTSGTLEYTITDLDNGTEYDVQVRAVNANGDGTWSGTTTGTPALPAPTISSVRAEERALRVYWSAPADITTGVGAYDVRHIETSADESVDANWTVEEDAWEAGDGALVYTVTGLTNDTGYDVQVRAVDVDDVNGAWSDTTSATPADHGDTRTDATVVTSDDRIQGFIDPSDDEDYFSLTVTGTMDLWLNTLGDLDTVGELQDSNGVQLKWDDYGGSLPNVDNFFLWYQLKAGTYYIKVTGFGDTDTPYTLRVRAFEDTLAWSTAPVFGPGESVIGTIDPVEDIDNFRLRLTETTEVVIRSSGGLDLVATLYNSRSQRVAGNDDGYLPTTGRKNFLIRRSLQAGDYRVAVSSFNDRYDGPFSVYAHAITEPGSTKTDAQTLALRQVAGGHITPAGDEDYFTFTLSETTYVIVGGVSRDTDIDAELLDSTDTEALSDTAQDDHIFAFQGELDAGTYYLKVKGAESTDTGRYTVRAVSLDINDRLDDRCSGLSRGSGINDPLYGCQWHLDNDDQFRNSAGQDLRVEEVWPTYTGDGITVAVVDDGLDFNHEDLSANVDTSRNHNYDSNKTSINDYYGWHGTAVAGIIAAKGNSVGVRGIAPDATIYGYNYLEGQSDANQADAMSRNASTTAVSNHSYGFERLGKPSPTTRSWEMAVVDGVTNGYGGKGVFYTHTAGNSGEDNDYSNLDEADNFYAITTVCAIGHDDKRSSYSEMGPNLWVCGPSNSGRPGQPGIYTTDNGNLYWDRMGGTSASTPAVAGVAALIRGANTALTWRDVKLILAGSARKADSANAGWETGALRYGSTSDRYNYNHEYGFGMADAKAAIDLAASWTLLPDFRETTVKSGTINLSIPDAPTSGTPTTVSTKLTIPTFVQFIEFVEIDTHFSHSKFRDLHVELESPSGAVSVLTPSADVVGQLRSAFRFGSARHLGENAAGEWTLRIRDESRTNTGRLRSWGLTFYGHGYIPDALDIDTVTAGGGTLAVAWNEPEDTGRGSISSYDLRYIRENASDKSDANWTQVTGAGSVSTRNHTITGLTGGVEYEIQVRARNADGIGLWSESTKGTPTVVKPHAPSITAVTRGDRTLAVAWNAPSDNGGGAITAYDIQYIDSTADKTDNSNWRAGRSNSLSYVIGSLTNGTQYDVQVRAVNSAGNGAWSSTVSGTPLPDDIPIRMAWQDATPEFNEDAGSVSLTAVFTTTYDAPPEGDFTFDVSLTVTDLQTTENDDYTFPPPLTNFVASDFSQTDVNGQQRYRATRDFTFLIIDDTVDESVENVRVTMNYQTPGLAHLQGGPQALVITILDNEHVPVTLSWEHSDVEVDEDDGSVTLRAYAITTVDKRPEAGFTFDATFSSSNGSAAEPGDYAEVDETVTFDRGDFSRVTVDGNLRYRAAKQIAVDIEDDTSDEVDEDLTVTIEYANPGPTHLQGGAAVATITIADNDDVPITLGWDETNVTVSEDAGTVTLYVQATTTEDTAPQSDVAFDVNVSTRDGSARQGSEYKSASTAVRFLYSDFSTTVVDGNVRYRAEKQVTVEIVDDIYDEPDEDFRVTVVFTNPRPTYAQGSSQSATVTVMNDDLGGPKPPPPPNPGGGASFGPAPIAPKFADGFRTTRALPVNAQPGEAIGDPVSATHEHDLVITYSLSGADASLFTVDEATGLIQVNDGLELEVGTTYTLNLTATDTAGFGAIIIVIVEVTEAAHHAYDLNRNGLIDRAEVITAISDYFAGNIGKNDVIELIKLYFSGST